MIMELMSRIRIKKSQGDRLEAEYVWVNNYDIVRVRKIMSGKTPRYELLIRDIDMGQATILTDVTEEVARKLGLEGEFTPSIEIEQSDWARRAAENKKKLDEIISHPMPTPAILEAMEKDQFMSGSATAVSREDDITPLPTEEEVEQLRKQLEKLEAGQENESAFSSIVNKERAENLLD
jgi:hypothetical protein